MIRKPTLDVFSDDQILLRRVQLTDLGTVYDSVRASLPELQTTMPWASAAYSHSDAADWLARTWLSWSSGSAFEFLITAIDGGRMLGLVGLNAVDAATGRANLGYWVRSDETGRGVCTAAARMVAHFGFEELELSRIRLYHVVENIGSQRVAEKVGFVLEGRQRARVACSGQLQDTLLYSLIDPSEIRDD